MIKCKNAAIPFCKDSIKQAKGDATWLMGSIPNTWAQRSYKTKMVQTACMLEKSVRILNIPTQPNPIPKIKIKNWIKMGTHPQNWGRRMGWGGSFGVRSTFMVGSQLKMCTRWSIWLKVKQITQNSTTTAIVIALQQQNIIPCYKFFSFWCHMWED